LARKHRVGTVTLVFAHVTEVAKLYSGGRLLQAMLQVSEVRDCGETVSEGRAAQDRAVAAEDLTPNIRWYAAAVSPRHEKVVATNLKMREVDYFLPLYRSVRRWKDRRKELDMVLFPGYVFVKVDLRYRLRVLQSPGVLSFITFQGHPVPLENSEIESLAIGLGAGLRAEPHPYLRPGRRVRIVRGPLANVEGMLVRRKERFHLVLSIDLIMRSVLLEVDEADVQAI
jgi:transcription antitermination factor NusG